MQRLKTRFRPLGSRILIQEIPDDEISPGGIIIPDTAKEKPTRGRVVALGTGGEEDFIVNEGDEILFSKYVGSEIKMEGEKFLIIREDEIFGVLE